MYEGINVKVRFAVVYTLLGVYAAAVLALAVVFWTKPPAATKHDLLTTAQRIEKELGPTTEKSLVAQAQKAVSQAASSQGVTLTNEKVLKVTHPDPLTVIVYIKATTAEYGDITLKVPFKKGIYALGALERA